MSGLLLDRPPVERPLVERSGLRPTETAAAPDSCPDRASVTEVLSQHPISDLRRLDVVESDAEILLEGIVGSYYHKQMAQEAIRSSLGGKKLCNRVCVSLVSRGR